jgi:L-ascorbate metabolism protein UlaG (beta-lactamase superfamily)
MEFPTKWKFGWILKKIDKNSAWMSPEFPLDGMTADAVFLSIGGRKDTASLIDHVITPLHPATVIPIHFDDLFGPVDKKIKPLIGVDLNEFWAGMAKTDGAFAVNTLPVGEARVLFY